MRPHHAIVLGLIGLTLPLTTLAQTGKTKSGATRSKCEIIAAMATDPDELALSKDCRQYEFNVLRSGATAPAKTVPTAQRQNRNYVKPARTATPGTARRVRGPADPAQVLDMRLTFDRGSALLTEQAKAEARVFAEAMQSPALANSRFTVGGHTDAIGSRAYNLDLSRRRAEAVVEFLVAHGADRSRLIPSGYGFDRPRTGLSSQDAANRRVEFARTG